MYRLGATVATMTVVAVAGFPGLAATASTPPSAPPAIRGLAHRAGGHGTAGTMVGRAGGARAVVTTSNWAGYVATGTAFTDVVGSWTEPAVTCTGKAQQAAFWVGFDGWLALSPLEQVGSDSDCTKKGASYYAWWQMYPATYHTFPHKLCPVAPGDTLTASVTKSGNDFTLRITDTTRGVTCPIPTQTSSAPATSAEWVVEDPSSNLTGSLLKLADFGTVNFSGASADDTSLSSLTSDGITMQTRRGGAVILKAETTPIFADGASFGVTWQHS